jgi:hypothetical protein
VQRIRQPAWNVNRAWRRGSKFTVIGAGCHGAHSSDSHSHFSGSAVVARATVCTPTGMFGAVAGPVIVTVTVFTFAGMFVTVKRLLKGPVSAKLPFPADVVQDVWLGRNPPHGSPG